jgi:hypothetical protein
MQKLTKLLTITLIALLPAFVSAQQKTSIELQNIQTRTFEYNEKGVFRAVLSVLQNNKYENIRSDSAGGLITATLPPLHAGDSASEQTGKAIVSGVVGAIIPFGDLLGPSKKIGDLNRTISVVVEELKPNQTSVRVVLKETEILTVSTFLATEKQTKENDMTDRPEIYQQVFEQIDKEIFVRKSR